MFTKLSVFSLLMISRKLHELLLSLIIFMYPAQFHNFTGFFHEII